jgi:hypothetical protein
MINCRMIWLLLLLLLGTTLIFPQPADIETSSTRRIIEEIKAHNQGITAWWTGHNGWLIKADIILIGTDLALESDERAIAAPISAAELAPDYIFPQHRNTFQVTPENRYWTSGYPYEVKFRLSKSLQERYHILEIGEKQLIQ